MASAWFLGLIVIFYALHSVADERFSTPVERFYGRHEKVWIKTSDRIPSFDAPDWRVLGVKFNLRTGAPITGSHAIGYAKDEARVFEVYLEWNKNPILVALVYYLDGKTPRIFQKRSQNTPEGADVFFAEKHADELYAPQNWPPDRLFIRSDR